jgi:outer membrane protein OmpA-like peptidoglycan-associated protein
MEPLTAPKLGRVALGVVVLLGAALGGCATRRTAPAAAGSSPQAELEGRLARLEQRLGQVEAGLGSQGERLDRLERQAGEATARAEAAGRRADAAAAAAGDAAIRADRAVSAAAEAGAAAARAAQGAGQALGRVEAVEGRLARQAAARQGETAVETAVVQFAFDRWTLDARAQAVLADVVTRLQQDPTLLVTLEGFADSVGSDGYNFELSRKRAEAVRRFLVDRGVGLRRIEHIGFGETHPVADNATPAGRARNRRVVIKVAGAE